MFLLFTNPIIHSASTRSAVRTIRYLKYMYAKIFFVLHTNPTIPTMVLVLEPSILGMYRFYVRRYVRRSSIKMQVRERQGGIYTFLFSLSLKLLHFEWSGVNISKKFI